MKIAFLGLGLMGTPLATRLIKAGYDVTVYNRNRAKTRPLVNLGARAAERPQEAAKGADLVVSMVSDPAAVKEVHFGEQGSVHGLKEGAIVVEMSTIDPSTARENRDQFAAKGIHYIDSPVSGSINEATNGTLLLLVGAASEDLEKARLVLEKLSAKVYHLGVVGQGSAMKLTINALIALTVYSYAEVINFAQSEGLSREAVIQFINSTRWASEGLKWKSESFLKDDYTPAFYTKHLTKDVNLALGEADKNGVELPALKKVTELYQEAINQGLSEEDFSSVLKILEKRNSK